MYVVLLKIVGALTAWAIFFYTIFQVDYPSSLVAANPYQLSYFFIPLFLGLTLFFSLRSNILSASSIALGLIILLILRAFDSLNLVTGIITTIATFLLASAFKNISIKSRVKRSLSPRLTPIQSGLTLKPKKPKLTRKL